MSAETTPLLLKSNLKQLKLPTMLGEWEKLAREAAAKNEPYESYLLRLPEAEVTARAANALAARIRAIVAVSAPSSLAVEFARDSNQSLYGFVRDGSANRYA